ncbi:hypothetical protein ZIOFF_033098 [Zingiber officinale]|uniref:FAE domain-containing protein n=1 Tax=Zingiber officinale TaxID=94328 RepID=A0A8J5GJF9_ZINOF|nr:hypothetical protein ZIOFF_033098 [Zingiber officinale]
MSNASNDPIALVAFDSIWSQSAVVLIWANAVTSPVSAVDHFMLAMSSPIRPPRARHEQRAAARLLQVAGALRRAVASKQQVQNPLFSSALIMAERSPEAPLLRSRSSRLSDFKQSIKLKYVKLGYHYMITHGMFSSACSSFIVAAQLSTFSLVDLRDLWNHLRFNLVSVVLCSTLLVFFSTVYFLTRPRPVYLLDFACHEPDESWKCSRKLFLERSKLSGSFTEENLEFQHKILERSGLGENTYLPDAVLNVPPNPCMDEAWKEAKDVVFGAIDELIAKTNIKPKDIGILVVNCSLFNPTPSLSTMVVNHYKLKENIVSYNLGGMGCSAGPISIDLTKNLLQVHPNSYALVISMENITLNWYFGNDRSMLKLTGTQDKKYAYEKWERPNHLSLMIMKGFISSDIRGGVPNSENAKDFLDFIEEQFQSSSKALAATLIIKMVTSKYNDLGSVRGHILRMNDMAAQL